MGDDVVDQGEMATSYHSKEKFSKMTAIQPLPHLDKEFFLENNALVSQSLSHQDKNFSPENTAVPVSRPRLCELVT